ncbi:MAG: photosystem II biogenesis protein Psp29 [Gloeomargarita sp. SKYBB_i_bin120]|nr:photosystem II biogenesis protein Psp29 [Gloeomargarita sp. SKYG98]MCS7292381.1 photosystem II biogenesis protein Psp29 [Gloeomargarita sp. SKYB120]MDW8177941.1 photosystem II biogenesis protein Psp29 [Gloeomargarita sp. SKYBB_i_bin120]
MSAVPTVADTKRAFYQHYPRPIHSVYQRVVEELLVEMHLLHVNVAFRYQPLYALGVVTAFDTLMQHYTPPAHRDLIFQALCRALHQDPQQYRKDAERLLTLAQGDSGARLRAWLAQPETPLAEQDPLQRELRDWVTPPVPKYSRLAAVGLWTLVQTVLPEASEQWSFAMQTLAQALQWNPERVQRDVDLYRSTLERLTQARAMLADMRKGSAPTPPATVTAS